MSPETAQASATKQPEHQTRMQARKKEQDAKVRSKNIRRGVIIVNTGDGKGKSTAAFGLVLRAIGNNQRVGIVQFIKGKWKTGERRALERFPEVDHVVSGEGFTWNTQDYERDVAAAQHGWSVVQSMIEDSRNDPPKYQLLILDELNIALRYEHLPISEVVETLSNKPSALNIAVTGRGAKPELVALADTVTEMTPIKHAFEAGIRAARGIEF